MPLTLGPKETQAPALDNAARAPVAWWKLDETEGTAAADATAHRPAARIQGTPRWTAGQGRHGGALALDGAQNLVDCGGGADFDFRSALTVSLWVKPGEPKKRSQTLIAKGNDTWRLQSAGENGGFVFALSGPGTTGKDRKKAPRAASKRALDDGQWHHLLGVYDGQRIAFYVDGALEDSVAASGPLSLNTEPVWLGNNSSARGESFQGSLDDVRLYRCSLSEGEIKALYRGEGK